MTHSSGHHGHMPTLQELETKSGRTPEKIRVGLQELVEKNYIEWKPGTPTESTLILEGWERDDPAGKVSQAGTQKPQQITTPGNMDYWQYY
ncbi:hypothetical protein [Paenibacillus monticola]|uniref:Uncharacterized protein n=1 Tax=Paenibacillus monticola TaxID=2666075 RepID=A0A7X2H1U7_9BACL|nr:hypothetical protein [Paenibacillus monticola]MRN52009.1 hypothetical protein [Paenibacillus monticola]